MLDLAYDGILLANYHRLIVHRDEGSRDLGFVEDTSRQPVMKRTLSFGFTEHIARSGVSERGKDLPTSINSDDAKKVEILSEDYMDCRVIKQCCVAQE